MNFVKLSDIHTSVNVHARMVLDVERVEGRIVSLTAYSAPAPGIETQDSRGDVACKVTLGKYGDEMIVLLPGEPKP